jgi:hypothetical protein
MKNPLTPLDIIDISLEAHPQIQAHTTHHVLCFLLESPEFDLQTYPGKDSAALKPPPPVDQLPSGPDHVTHQYMLGTVNIPEASYEDHEHLLEEWCQQLGWGSLDAKKKAALEKFVAWVGDQLTIDWLHGLFKFQAEDLNSFDQLDWMVLVFRWLHLQMAFANSLHKQYLGTSSGCGLRHAFELLEQKGLTSVSTKGPFHDNSDEALYHIAEAHLCVDWLSVGGVKNLPKLRSKQPDKLKQLAETLV